MGASPERDHPHSRRRGPEAEHHSGAPLSRGLNASAVAKKTLVTSAKYTSGAGGMGELRTPSGALPTRRGDVKLRQARPGANKRTPVVPVQAPQVCGIGIQPSYAECDFRGMRAARALCRYSISEIFQRPQR